MKKIGSSFLVLFLMIFTSFVIGQNTNEGGLTSDFNSVKVLEKTTSFGFGVTTEQPLRGAFMTYDGLMSKGVKIDNFEIVIWGKILKDIKEEKNLFEFVEKNMNKNIEVSVCAIAMNRLGLTLADLPKGIQLTDNAYIRIFELQALGYNFIIP